MKRALWILLPVTLLVTIGVALYYRNAAQVRPDTPPVAAPVAQPAEPAPRVIDPVVRHPIDQVEAPQAARESAPPDSESGESLALAELGRLLGEQARDAVVVRDHLVHRFVATVDNLSRSKAPRNVFPVTAAPGAFEAARSGERTVIAPRNALRYAAYVRMLEGVDSRQLVHLYSRLYPLFQKAYQELGYPTAYFNDRLVELIDLLIATPDVQEPIALVQPKVLYQFADPALESLPAGQKVMLRIGHDNAQRVKAKLVEIRRLLTGQREK
jgi:hypothetical protein